MFKFDNVIYNIEFEKMNKINKINNVNNINRTRKLKIFSLIINFNKKIEINCFKINIKLT